MEEGEQSDVEVDEVIQMQCQQELENLMSSDKNSVNEYACPICMDLFVNPSTIPCGHTFCERCIAMWFLSHKKYGKTVCPKCRTDVPFNSLGPCNFIIKSKLRRSFKSYYEEREKEVEELEREQPLLAKYRELSKSRPITSEPSYMFNIEKLVYLVLSASVVCFCIFMIWSIGTEYFDSIPEIRMEDLSRLRISQLKVFLRQRGATCSGCMEKDSFVEAARLNWDRPKLAKYKSPRTLYPHRYVLWKLQNFWKDFSSFTQSSWKEIKAKIDL